MIRFAHWISLIVVMLACCVVGAADLYVSQTGNDGQDGSLARPLTSLRRPAIESVRLATLVSWRKRG